MYVCQLHFALRGFLQYYQRLQLSITDVCSESPPALAARKNDMLGCKLLKVESHIGKEHGALVQILTHYDNSGSTIFIYVIAANRGSKAQLIAWYHPWGRNSRLFSVTCGKKRDASTEHEDMSAFSSSAH